MGKGGEEYTVGYRYYAGMQHALCHGPVDGLLRITVDEKVAWEGWNRGGRVSVYAEDLFGGESREGGISGALDFELGGPNQGQNDYLAASLGTELLPAFRGVCAAVLRQMYLGINPYLKAWSWRLSRIHISNGGTQQWYDAKAEILAQEYIGQNPYVKYDFDLPTSIWGSDDLHSVPGHPFAYHCAGGRYVWKIDLATHQVVGKVDYMCWSVCRYGLSPDGSKLYFQTGDYHLACIDTETMTVGKIGSTPAYGCYGLTVGKDVVYGWGMLNGSKIWVYNRETLDCIGSVDNGEFHVGEIKQASLDPSDDTVWALVVDHWVDLYNSGAWVVHDSPTSALGGWDISADFPGGAEYLCYDIGTRCCFISDGSTIIKWAVNTQSTIGSVSLPLGPYAHSAFEQGVVNNRLCLVSGGKVYWLDAETCTLSEDLDITDNYQIETSGWLYDSTTCSLLVAGTSPPGIFQLQYKKIPGDMNPAHIIRECLTNTAWGMGYPESDIDDDSFMTAADMLYAEGMGISILWEQATDIEAFITDILRHIEGSLYTDRSTGKFVLKLVRYDYDEDSLLVLNESNISRIENFSRQTMAELTNEVLVTYWDLAEGATKTGSIQDIALIQAMGMVSSVTVDYPGFTNAGIAYRVAQRDLKTLSTPHISCEVYANRQASGLNIGDVFKLSWAPLDIESLIMRVTGISMGGPTGNEIRVECLQDVFSLPDMQLMAEEKPAWDPPALVPLPPNHQLAFEAPYFELVQRQGQETVDSRLATLPEAGYIGMAAVRPNTLSINARIYTDSGGGYEEHGSVDFCPSATLAAAIGYTDTVVVLENAIDIDLITVGTWAQIDDELVAIDAISNSGATIRRGVLDTAPARHAAGARLYCWDVYSGSDKIEYVSGDDVEVKLCTVTGSGVLPLAAAPVSSVILNQRAVRPYPPGNLQINSSSYPSGPFEGELTISWAHRDRTQQTSETLQDYSYGDIGPETGTTYTVRCYVDEVLNVEQTGLLTTLTTLTPTGGGSCRIAVYSVRDGHESWQAAAHAFEYLPAFDLRTTEDGSGRETENGSIRRVEEDL